MLRPITGWHRLYPESGRIAPVGLEATRIGRIVLPMNILGSPRFGRALLLGLLGFGLTQCKTSTAVAPAVSPAAVVAPGAPPTAQRALVASLVTAAPAKIVADLDALSRRLGLP